MTRRSAALALATATALAACAAGSPRPAEIDTRNDACAACRMIVSETRTAAQVIAPGEEPLVFDDLRCLRDGLRVRRPPPGAAVFVVDYRTGAWVPASRAVFARQPRVPTPMASHWIAFADEASRRADPLGAVAEPLAPEEILGTGEGAPR